MAAALRNAFVLWTLGVDLIKAIDMGINDPLLITSLSHHRSLFMGRSELRVSGRTAPMDVEDQRLAQGHWNWSFQRCPPLPWYCCHAVLMVLKEH